MKTEHLSKAYNYMFSGLGIPDWMTLDSGTGTAVGIAIGLLILSAVVAVWLRSCRKRQHRASQAAAGGSTIGGQPGFRSMFHLLNVCFALKSDILNGDLQR